MTSREKRLPILSVIAGVLVVAAVAVGAFAGYRFWNDRQAEQARTASVDAARRTVAAMFTYDFNTVDTQLPKAADSLTPTFKGDYLKLINAAIAPGAKQKQLTVQATTQAAGVVSADRSHAVVLLYLNEVTTSAASPQGTVTPSRVRVSLEKDGGRWLVGEVTPV
ncbi:h domain protein [Nocardia macrotermitis]|uniref:Mce-associated membrane protein n=1 Tax=Nocardia macrotermitis TaxID=2585198 RepID=A0A7K0D142_9NOCA|nr:h domain protein [Nocardia macrotermitis]MQY19433.1 hypothetical protein [Nocardia macrotermitis]